MAKKNPTISPDLLEFLQSNKTGTALLLEYVRQSTGDNPTFDDFHSFFISEYESVSEGLQNIPVAELFVPQNKARPAMIHRNKTNKISNRVSPIAADDYEKYQNTILSLLSKDAGKTSSAVYRMMRAKKMPITETQWRKMHKKLVKQKLIKRVGNTSNTLFFAV